MRRRIPPCALGVDIFLPPGRNDSSISQGIAGAQPSLCLSAAALGDGIHGGTAGADDATGLRAPDVPFTVRIDATPPAVRALGPAAVAGDGRPLVELDVSDATSGIASVLAQIDGTTVPLDLDRRACERSHLHPQ